MIGLGTMGMISNRLIQACPDAPAGERFGGISIILLGDFNQLPPVFDKPLYYAGPLGRSRTEELKLAGRRAYINIDRTVRLETIMRQQGDAESAFRDTLQAIRSMNCTAGQWELLSTRYQGNLPAATVDSFRDSIRVYTTNARVNAYNLEHLEALREPIIAVKALS
jgi:ATP-dependent DNA helicase PIF1